MTALTRDQFVAHWNNVKPGLGDADSNLWAYERHTQRQLEWFFCTRPIRLTSADESKYEFWDWCRQHCPNGVSCYSANDQEEWWGFGDYNEMLLWTLKHTHNDCKK